MVTIFSACSGRVTPAQEWRERQEELLIRREFAGVRRGSRALQRVQRRASASMRPPRSAVASPVTRLALHVHPPATVIARVLLGDAARRRVKLLRGPAAPTSS